MTCEHAMKPPKNPPMEPRILLVEDDAASRLFLAAALEALPANVTAAGSVAEAAMLAEAGGFDAWLFDAHLPDGSGAGLLWALRATNASTPAIAHTASRDHEVLDALRVAGFADVLVKPLSAASLQAAVRRLLTPSELANGEMRFGPLRVAEPRMDATPPVWNDAAALAALNGQSGHVAALRGLFLAELPAQREAVHSALARDDVPAAQAELHRLQAGCGFVGATQLAAAVDGLQRDSTRPAALDAFQQAVQATMASAGIDAA